MANMKMNILWIVVLLFRVTAAGRELAPRTYDALSGSMLVRNDMLNGTRRDFVEFFGWKAPDRNTPCGHAARMRVHDLLHSNKIYLEDADDVHHSHEGRFVRAYTENGESLEKVLIREGLAFVGKRESDDELIRLQDAAMEIGIGCHQNAGQTSHWETSGAHSSAKQVQLDQTSQRPVIESNSFPTGFRRERWLLDNLVRPVDLVFLPDGTMVVAVNEGVIYTVDENRRLRGRPFWDLRPYINTFHDRGLMGIAIPRDYATNPWMVAFIVWEHDTRPSRYEGPKSSSVMKVRPDGTGLREDPTTRQIILGTVHGPGCDGFAANADCIPTEGKSHVGGGLAFRSDRLLYVSVGDGAVAIVTPVSLRAQHMDTYAGKVLRINLEGEGVPSNPWFDGDRQHRISKMYAKGTRNIFALHVNPTNDDNVYAGDTMWNDEEELNVIRRNGNYEWPCYEGTIRRPEYRNDPECPPRGGVRYGPTVAWRHDGQTSSSMVGGKISIPGWPQRYRDVVVYGDQARRFIGFCRLNRNDELIEDMERVTIPEGAVQYRVGPGNSLYWVNVRGDGDIIRLSYRANPEQLRMQNIEPREDGVVAPGGAQISGTFSKSVEPDTVADNVRLIETATGNAVATTLRFDYARRSFTLTPTGRLPAGTRFSVIVDGGERGVRDLDRNILRRSLRWSFSTSGAGDRTRPLVQRTRPANNAARVAPNFLIRVEFDEAMNPESVVNNFRIQVAEERGDWTTVAPALPTDAEYHAASRELWFSARTPLAYDTHFMVTIIGGAGGAADTSGNTLREDHQFVFQTSEDPSQISIDITQPAEGAETEVGADIAFAARATMSDGTVVPASAFTWQYNVLHCAYDAVNECHDHGEYIFTGVRGGTTRGVDHADSFQYEFRLTVTYRGQTATAVRLLSPRTVPYTFQSEPAGVLLSLSGYTRATPFTQPVAVGSTSQIFAPPTWNDLEFDRWEHGGDRVQERTVTGGRRWVAHYRPRGVPAGGTNYVRFRRPAVEMIPRRGKFTILVEYRTDVRRAIKGAVRSVGLVRHQFGTKVGVPAGEGSVSLIFDNEDVTLISGDDYTIDIDLRASLGDVSTAVAAAQLRVEAGEIDGNVATDSIISVRPPSPITMTGILDMRVSYQASQARDLNGAIYDQETKEVMGVLTMQVGPTAETVTTRLRIPIWTPLVRGRSYNVWVQIRPVGLIAPFALDREVTVVTA